MSTREMAYALIDRLSDEQLEGFVMMFKGLIDDNKTPNAETLAVIDDVENGRSLSRSFDCVEELWDDLNSESL